MNYVNYVNSKNCEMRGSPSYLQMLLLVMVSFVLFPSLTYAFWARKKYNATHKISARIIFYVIKQGVSSQSKSSQSNLPSSISEMSLTVQRMNYKRVISKK